MRLTARYTQGGRPLGAQPLPPTLIPPPLTHAGLALACGLLQPGDLLLSVNEVEVEVTGPVVSADPSDALIRGDECIRAAPDQHLVRVYSADQLVLRFRRPPVSDSPADHTPSESP